MKEYKYASNSFYRFGSLCLLLCILGKLYLYLQNIRRKATNNNQMTSSYADYITTDSSEIFAAAVLKL